MVGACHPARESQVLAGPGSSVYLAVLARLATRGDHQVWIGPANDTPRPPYGMSEEDLHRAYLDSCRGGPSLVEVDQRMRPAGPPGPLEPALAELERKLRAMKSGRTNELAVEVFAERGVLTSRVTGSCGRCSDRMQVPVDGGWRECSCAAPRATAARVAQAGLPADAQEAVGARLRPWRFVTEAGPAAGASGAARIDEALAEWMGTVVRKERMDKPLLYLTGAYRAGKSWTAMRMGLQLCRSRVAVRWRNLVDLLAQMRKGIDEGTSADDIAEVLSGPGVGVLILDDLGAGGGGSDWYVSIFEALIGRRVEARRPTIITSNLARADLGSVVGARLAARMVERMLAVGFSGPPKEGAP
jgi:hypothetical protein